MNRSFLALAWIVCIGLTGLTGIAGATEPAQAKSTKASQEELKVDVNNADVKELTKLPGVGEQVAKRIVAYRDEHGPFQRPEELMNVRGIGEKTFLKLQPYLVLGGDREKRKK